MDKVHAVALYSQGDNGGCIYFCQPSVATYVSLVGVSLQTELLGAIQFKNGRERPPSPCPPILILQPLVVLFPICQPHPPIFLMWRPPPPPP